MRPGLWRGVLANYTLQNIDKRQLYYSSVPTPKQQTQTQNNLKKSALSGDLGSCFFESRYFFGTGGIEIGTTQPQLGQRKHHRHVTRISAFKLTSTGVLLCDQF